MSAEMSEEYYSGVCEGGPMAGEVLSYGRKHYKVILPPIAPPATLPVPDVIYSSELKYGIYSFVPRANEYNVWKWSDS